LIVTMAVTGLALVILAVTAGQVDSVMAAGSAQVMFTCPVKPPVGVRVTWAVPDPPGADIVTLAIDPIVKVPVTVKATVVVAVKLPDVPVMVTVVGPPVVAELLAVSVSTLVVVVLVGLKDAVTPLGRPEAARLTLPVKPPVGFTVIVLVPLVPWATLKVVGLADSVKFGGGATVSAIVVVAVRLPDVPVIVIVAGPPNVAEPLALSVSTLVVVVLVGLKDAVTPLGRPEAARLTLPVKPPVRVTVIVLVPLLPCAMLKVLGAADSVKPGVALRLYSQIPRP
jgi:hypothetical protein